MTVFFLAQPSPQNQRKIRWDALDHLLSATETNPASPFTAKQVNFLYDLQGRRVQKTVSVGGVETQLTTTLWDGWRPVMDTVWQQGSGTTLRYYTWGPDVSGTIDGAAGVGGLLEIATVTGGATTRSLPVYDGVGNVVGLVDGSTGVQVATYQYGPFGEVLGESGIRTGSCPFRYQTRLYDEETGLCYFGKRYYDPKTQAWLSRDPLREGGGVNLYAYCGNNPVSGHDPIGLAEAFEAGLDANGMPQVHYWDWTHWWGALAGGATHTWWQAPNEAELARLFRQNAVGGWRLASESERHDVFWQQFNTSFPGAMQNAGQSFDVFAKLNGGAFAAVSGVGLIAEGSLTLGTGIVVGHEAWFAGSSWGSLATGTSYPVTPEGSILQAFGASANAVNVTDALVSSGVPFLAGRGPLLSLPGPEWNPLNYRLVDVGVGMNGGNARLVYRGPVDLTDFRSAHILNRHRAGTGISGKTEFPASWADQQILHYVSDVATDPTATTGLGEWNSPYSISIRDGVEIRVDFYPFTHPVHAGKISTAYPINVPPNP